jgi:hypothetical protein
MEKPTKFDVLMAAIQQLQARLDDIDGRLKRIEHTVAASSERSTQRYQPYEPLTQRYPPKLRRPGEPFPERPRRQFTED